MLPIRRYAHFVNLALNRTYSKQVKYKKDPGFKYQKKLFDTQDLDDEPENLEPSDVETDFMNLHKSYRHHVRETQDKSEQHKYLIVKQKYFKEKFPNFLTWHDKEQIKFLHSNEPEEWTVEKLSESFPALPEVVMKILKSNFSKKEAQIKNHDKNVEKNWEEFKQGKLQDLPEEFIEHLKKFTSRKLNKHNVVYPTKAIVSPLKCGFEFADIIKSYEKLKNKHSTNDEIQGCQEVVTTTTIIKKEEYKSKPKTKNNGETTLAKMEDSIKSKAFNSGSLTPQEQVMLSEITKPKENSTISSVNVNLNEIAENKYETKSVMVQKPIRDYSHLIYPEKIMIPKEFKKRGYTYKLNDCYYDHDGEFLYRVPGMT